MTPSPQWPEPPQKERKPFGSDAVKKAYGAGEGEILRDYLPLLNSIVNHLRAALPPHVEVEDLISAGLVGLVQAHRRYDASVGATFGTYAAGRIRGAVLDELRRSDWMGRSCRTKARMISEAISTFEQAKGGPATEEDIAEELGLTAEQYAGLLDEVKPVCYINLDASSDSGDADMMHELIADERAVTADVAVDKREMAALVAARIQQMPEMTRKVLAMYYFEEMRLAEIARCFHVTESRICQINAHAILCLRRYMQSLISS